MMAARRQRISDVLFVLGCVFFVLGSTDLFSLRGFMISASALLFLASLVFSRIVVPNIYALIFAVCCAFITVSSVVFYGFNVSNIIFYLVAPTIMLFVGRESRISKWKINGLFLSFVLGFLIKSMIMINYTAAFGGWHFYNFLLLPWGPSVDGLTYISRNSLTLYSLPIICAVPVLASLSFLKRKWYVFLVVLTLAGFAVWMCFSVGNRAVLIVMIVLAAAIVLDLLLRIKKTLVKAIIISVLAALFILFILVFIGLIPLPSALLNIPIIQRILSGGSNAERLQLYVGFFQNAWRYPFGGLYNHTGRYVHNFYLDIYNSYGLIPFVCFGVLYVFALIRSFRHKDNNIGAKIVFWSLLCFLALGLVEPIIQTDNVVFLWMAVCFGYASALPFSPKGIVMDKFSIGSPESKVFWWTTKRKLKKDRDIIV